MRKKGQLAHIDRNHANSRSSNLAYLCLRHHDEYDSRPSQSKGIIPGELRRYRDALHLAIERGEHLRKDRIARKRVEISPEVLAHERATFSAGDAIVGESALLDTLDRLGGDHSILRVDASAMGAFVSHFSLESHRFLLRELSAPLEDLMGALRNLNGYIAEHFFVYPERPLRKDEAMRLCMYPELNIDRGGHYSTENDIQYARYARKLRDAVAKAEETYREYRRTVKRTLLV